MRLAAQFEEYRLQQVRRLEEEKKRISSQKAEIKAEEAKLDQQFFRLEDKPPADDSCPSCFFHGRLPSTLTPIPSDRGDVDRFRCRQCGYEAEISD